MRNAGMLVLIPSTRKASSASISAVKNAYRVQHGWYEGAVQGSFDLVAI